MSETTFNPISNKQTILNEKIAQCVWAASKTEK